MAYKFFTFFAFYLLAGGIACLIFFNVTKVKKCERPLIVGGLLFRIVLTYVYYLITLQSIADASRYHSNGKAIWLGLRNIKYSPGTTFVDLVAASFYPAVSVFDDTYLMMFIPFSVCAFIGSLLFYKTLSDNNVKNITLRAGLSFFMPNLIFWTSSIGKDALIYLGITGVIFALNAKNTIRQKVTFVIFFSALIFFVRPHIFAFMLASLIGGNFLQHRGLNKKNLVIIGVSFVVFLLIQEPLFKFVGLGSLSEQNSEEAGVGEYYSSSMDKLQDMSTRYQGSGASIKRESKVTLLLAPYYFIQFVSIPFVWQARNALQLFAALEGTIYQVFLFIIIMNTRALTRSVVLPFKFSYVVYVVITATLLGMSTSNFGLGVRQKCMVLPPIIFLFGILHSHLNKVKVEKGEKKIQKRQMINKF